MPLREQSRIRGREPASTGEADGVPAGYRPGDGWTYSGGDYHRPGVVLSLQPVDELVRWGALVPLGPPGELEVAPPVSEEDCGRKVESGMVMMCSPSCVEAGRHLKKVLSPASPPGEGTVPVCSPDCGKTYGGTGETQWASTSPMLCSDACKAAGRPLNPPPVAPSEPSGNPGQLPPARPTLKEIADAIRDGSFAEKVGAAIKRADVAVSRGPHAPPAPVPVEAPRTWSCQCSMPGGECVCRASDALSQPAAEPAKASLSEQIDRWSTTIGKRPTLTLHQCAERARALEADLAEAKRRDREECCQSYKRLVEGERDAAHAEVEQLRAKLADCESTRMSWVRALANEQADARVLAMRTECAKGWEPMEQLALDVQRMFEPGSEGSRACSALFAAIVNRVEAIERLPLDGTASAVSQADALAMVRGTREAAAREIDRQAHICSYACDHAECKKARDDARRIRALPDTAYLDTEAWRGRAGGEATEPAPQADAGTASETTRARQNAALESLPAGASIAEQAAAMERAADGAGGDGGK